MAKISSVNNGESGSSARGKINTAMESVEVNAAEFSGDGNVGTALNLVDAGVKAAYEANADTNAFTDAEQTKLAGIEAGATGDQSNAEIKTAYEANLDTNAFTDAEKTKLGNIDQGVATTDSPSFAGLTVDSATLVVDSVNSRVGIGTASPMDCLDVESTDNQLARFVSTNGNGRIRISDATDDLFVGTAAGTAFFGPETSATGNNLQMDLTTGAATIPGGLSATLSTAAQPNITSLGTLTSATVSGDLTVDTDTLYVDSASGSVGIGRSAPQRSLHIENNASSVLARFKSDNTFGAGFELHNADTGADNWSIFTTASGNTGGAGGLAFFKQTGNTGGAGEKVRIDGDGNVGIGKNNPSAPLDVEGTILNSGNITSAGATTGASTIIQTTTSDASTSMRMFVSSSIGFFGTSGVGDVVMQVAGTTHSRFRSSGTININNAPTYADDTAAGSGGLVAGDIYKTAAGDLKIKL